MADQLDFWLGKCYESDLLGIGSHPEAKKAFKNLLVPGSLLEKKARERMSELSAIPKGRCFISDKQLEYLGSLLNG